MIDLMERGSATAAEFASVISVVGGTILYVVERVDDPMLVHLTTIAEVEKRESNYVLRQAFASKSFSFAGQPMGAVLKRKVTEDRGAAVISYTGVGDTGTTREGTGFDAFQSREDTLYPEVFDVASGERCLQGRSASGRHRSRTTVPHLTSSFCSGDLARLTTKPSSMAAPTPGCGSLVVPAT